MRTTRVIVSDSYIVVQAGAYSGWRVAEEAVETGEVSGDEGTRGSEGDKASPAKLRYALIYCPV